MPRTVAPSATASGVPPGVADARRDRIELGRGHSAERPRRTSTASAAPLRICAAVEVDAAHPRLGGERHEGRACICDVAAAEPKLLLGQRHDADRPSGVSSARLASCAASASASRRTPAAARTRSPCRLPSVMVPVLSRSSVSTSPAASTARPLVAMTFVWSIRSIPAMPIADSRPPIVVGIRQTRARRAPSPTAPRLEYLASGTQRHAGEEEDDGEPDQQDV